MLQENQFNEEDVIKDMSVKMKGKFDKYRKDYSIVLAFGAILDPRLKLDFFNLCYRKLDPSTSEEKVKIVKEKFKKLYRNIQTILVLQYMLFYANLVIRFFLSCIFVLFK